LGEGLADRFAACCKDSYGRHGHPGQTIDVGRYGDYVRDFLTTFPGALHVYATVGDQVVGAQTFIRHDRRLELTEGGFSATSKTYHAYENIIVASARYAVENGLEKVSYGLVSNPAKDRLMDPATRTPVFLVMFLRSRLAAVLCRRYRHKAHERFPMPYWRDRSRFDDLPL